MEPSVGLPSLLQRILLSCGIVASILYLGTDLLAGNLIKGYSFSTDSMSDLGAVGSPTRLLVVLLTLAASIFLLAFGAGVWATTEQPILARVVAGLICVNALTGLTALLFFPNRFGVRPEFATPGVLLSFFSVLSFVLAMILGAIEFSGWFRVFSITIPAAYIILAIFRFATAALPAAGGTASLIGTQERTMAYSFLLWVMVLAIYLLWLSSKGLNAIGSLGG